MFYNFNQTFSTLHMMDYSKEDLKEMMDKEANIKINYIKTMASAIHEGLKEECTIYCKYCGKNQ